jgi:hypothetical protein
LRTEASSASWFVSLLRTSDLPPTSRQAYAPTFTLQLARELTDLVLGTVHTNERHARSRPPKCDSGSKSGVYM